MFCKEFNFVAVDVPFTRTCFVLLIFLSRPCYIKATEINVIARCLRVLLIVRVINRKFGRLPTYEVSGCRLRINSPPVVVSTEDEAAADEQQE